MITDLTWEAEKDRLPSLPATDVGLKVPVVLDLQTLKDV